MFGGYNKRENDLFMPIKVSTWVKTTLIPNSYNLGKFM